MQVQKQRLEELITYVEYNKLHLQLKNQTNDNLFNEMEEVLQSKSSIAHFQDNAESPTRNPKNDTKVNKHLPIRPNEMYKICLKHYKKEFKKLSDDTDYAIYDYYSVIGGYFHVIPILTGIFYVGTQDWQWGKDVSIENDIMKYSFSWFLVDTLNMLRYTTNTEFLFHHLISLFGCTIPVFFKLYSVEALSALLLTEISNPCFSARTLMGYHY